MSFQVSDVFSMGRAQELIRMLKAKIQEAASGGGGASLTTEQWTFEMSDGTTVTRNVAVGGSEVWTFTMGDDTTVTKQVVTA